MADNETDLIVACKVALCHLDNYAASRRSGLDMTEVIKAQVTLEKAIRNHGGWK